MNSYERVEAALNHQTTDRIPTGNLCAGINPPAFRAFDEYLRKKRGIDANTYINSILDLTEVWSLEIGPACKQGFDYWGVKRRAVSYGEGSYDEIEFYPLATATTVAEIEAYDWPQTNWFDYSLVPAQINTRKARPDQVIAVSIANVFETAWYMRGFEQIMIDMMVQPELVFAMLERVCHFFTEHFRNYIRAAGGQVTMAFTGDDIGGQSGLLLPPEMWETFIKPWHKKMNQEFHELGVKVVYHSCGSVIDAIDGLIDMGIDVLQSVQLSARGMTPEALKQKAGSRLCFEGGVCVQKLLPFETKEKVEAEVKHLIDVLGKAGGYILGPAHYIQAGTPPENIEMMFETAKHYYSH